MSDLLTDDPKLLASARAGNAAAFCELARIRVPRLLREAVALCRDGHLAEDLVQETLVEAWRCFDRFDGRCRLSTWLYAILLHRYQKAVRHAGSRPRLSEADRSTPEEAAPGYNPAE